MHELSKGQRLILLFIGLTTEPGFTRESALQYTGGCPRTLRRYLAEIRGLGVRIEYDSETQTYTAS